jgi:hypothetical protein|tara:strand:+ start:105 stop:296 length:192 start_codon:yes stop_codon:yes gene_type:complete
MPINHAHPVLSTMVMVHVRILIPKMYHHVPVVMFYNLEAVIAWLMPLPAVLAAIHAQEILAIK